MANLSSELVEQLRNTANSAAGNAYAPYSGFHVGAALLFDDGAVVTGCNVENVSYSLTICAERTALVRAIAEGGAQRYIVAVVVTNLNGAASSPCGACLQMLSEFTTSDTMVYFATGSDMLSKHFTELLPFGFTNWKKDDDARG